MTWLRRNRIALGIILAAAGLVASTITYPSRATHLGHSRPESAVQVGRAADIGDAHWRLREVAVPDLAGSPAPPADSRFMAFAIDRDGGGAPTALPEQFTDCFASLQAGDRGWWGQSLPGPVRSWAQQQGYVTRCDRPGPWFIGMHVPEDVTLDAVDVHLKRRTAPGAPPSQGSGDLFADVRFTLR